jgi:hypothetical protein
MSGWANEEEGERSEKKRKEMRDKWRTDEVDIIDICKKYKKNGQNGSEMKGGESEKEERRERWGERESVRKRKREDFASGTSMNRSLCVVIATIIVFPQIPSLFSPLPHFFAFFAFFPIRFFVQSVWKEVRKMSVLAWLKEKYEEKGEGEGGREGGK